MHSLFFLRCLHHVSEVGSHGCPCLGHLCEVTGTEEEEEEEEEGME